MALLLWSPFDVYLFLRPLGSLVGLRREIVTLPVLFVLIFVVTLGWRRLRVVAARRATAAVRFDDLFPRLAQAMTTTRQDETTRQSQFLAVRNAVAPPS